MKNIVKIVSVLSGLLVFSAANAGELTVTGSMEATYKTSGEEATTGNPLGMDRELKFAGSTELDNGMTISVMQDTGDSFAMGNSQLAISGDLGTVYLGSDSDPVDSIDDITPSAYEEANGSGGGSGWVDVTGHAGGSMGLGVKTANLMGSGMDINYKYYPKVDGSKNADNASSGVADNSAEDGHSMTIRGNPMNAVDGLNIALGAAETGNTNTGTAGGGFDNLDLTAAINYAYGPVKVGVQKSRVQVINSDTSYDSEIFGIAYAVNESLSVSFNEIEQEKMLGDGNGATQDPNKQKATALNVSYAMGGATLGIQTVDVKNSGFTNDLDGSGTTIGLSVAF
ncbi:porin [Pelagibacteraceae bacterium]|jgi:outer membrane protein OmpU|nr:porin [Pelagibacteraceae bacterium]|tara:strand:+ start:7838 stop:8857 length:1020 start_codon:yes stop_codon:yes gene_type:complete